MRCAAVKDNIVQNVIEIRPAHKLGYERATESKLIALDDDMLVQVGDVHDAEAGVFLRDGVDVCQDDTLKVLRARAAALESENTLLKAQVQALSERDDFVEDVIAEMAMMIY